MNREVPLFDDCCPKEPFAFYGLASYASQLMEHSTLNLLLVLSLPSLDLCSKKNFYEISLNLEKKTLGQLLKRCKSKINISGSDIDKLEFALGKRNFLIHHFYKNNAENFISREGQIEMIESLREMTTIFDEADALLENIYKPLWDKYGFSQDKADELLKEAYARATNRDENA